MHCSVQYCVGGACTGEKWNCAKGTPLVQLWEEIVTGYVLDSSYFFLSWGVVQRLVLAIAQMKSAVEDTGAKTGCWRIRSRRINIRWAIGKP